MSGLVGYGSSDDGEDFEDYQKPASKALTQPTDHTSTLALDEPNHDVKQPTTISLSPTDVGLVEPLGPSLDSASKDGLKSASQSPYSSKRSLLHDLTLPTYVNLDIPPSPTGSPPPQTDQKFEHFLELKKQGVHFNEKLARSTALKNPSLLEKLMDFAGLQHGDQYSTSLSKDIWDPEGFPPYAYKEKLAEMQQAISKRREEEKSRLQRESIEFVSGTNSEHSMSGKIQSSELKPKATRVSVAERVMAGLNRERTRPTGAEPSDLQINLERRSGRSDGGILSSKKH